jgi:hypothetical protein
MKSRRPQARVLWAAAILAALLVVVPACGRRGPPLPPRPILPATVGDFRAEPREAGILLSWTKPRRNNDDSPLTDLQEFRLLRATGPLGEAGVTTSAFTLLATIQAEQPGGADAPGSLYAYRDDAGGQGLPTGVRYRYRVQAVNRQGGVGPLSAEVVVDLIPAPPAPAAVTAAAGDGTVDLAWQASSVADRSGVSFVKGYNVYRGVQPGVYGPRPINAAPIPETRFRDAGVGNDTTYYYIVRSVAGDRPPWRESGDSVQVSVTPQDSIAPAPPAGLVAIPGERDVALTWRVSLEADLLGYLVYRRELPHLVSVRLTDQPIPGTTFADRTARSGATYVYTVTAVDRSARRNESAPSAEVEVSLR